MTIHYSPYSKQTRFGEKNGPMEEHCTLPSLLLVVLEEIGSRQIDGPATWFTNVTSMSFNIKMFNEKCDSMSSQHSQGDTTKVGTPFDETIPFQQNTLKTACPPKERDSE